MAVFHLETIDGDGEFPAGDLMIKRAPHERSWRSRDHRPSRKSRQSTMQIAKIAWPPSAQRPH
jgi:hypothetical protein